jgi:ribonucleoside-triphosphate reductase
MPIYKIQKRNGTIVDFDMNKVQIAIGKAAKAIGNEDPAMPYTLAQDVHAQLDEMYSNIIPTVEQVQDAVEDALIQYGYADIAKAYILYRAKRSEVRESKDVVVEVNKTINEYLSNLDWRIKENANIGYSIGGLILKNSEKLVANYWLSHVYPQAVGDAHRNGDYHIHDLGMFTGYCAGWSLRALLEEGFCGVPEKTESGPPKHLSSAVAQMINFFGVLANEWAGAQAFSSLDTYLAPFLKKFEIELYEDIAREQMSFPNEEAKVKYVDRKVYDYAYQNIQSFIFNVNIPSRWGGQTPFTNITLDWNCPDDMKEKRLLLGGKPFAYTFGELQKEMDVINKVFIEVMIKGDAKGRTFTFPIPTYNITNDFAWDDPKNLPLFEMAAKYGTPYFQNFINSHLNPSDVRSMCCRLQLDLKELRSRGGGLFGSSEMTGSIGVVTINAARIGYLYRNSKEQFFDRINVLMELAKTSLEIKRKEIQKWMDSGLFPFTKRYLGSLHNHFSTIGINGINEAIRNFTHDQENIATPWGQQFAKEVLDFMRDKLQKFQEDTGNLYNLEATPAEGTTYRFAREDKKRFPDILQAGTADAFFYTNSSQLPVGYTDDIFEALDLQNDLQTKYTGGTVFHCYMSERISSAEACRNLVRKVLENYRIPYITITPTFSICPKHGYLTGEYDFCPKCDVEIGYDGTERFDLEYRKKYVSEKAER